MISENKAALKKKLPRSRQANCRAGRQAARQPVSQPARQASKQASKQAAHFGNSNIHKYNNNSTLPQLKRQMKLSTAATLVVQWQLRRCRHTGTAFECPSTYVSVCPSLSLSLSRSHSLSHSCFTLLSLFLCVESWLWGALELRYAAGELSRTNCKSLRAKT